MRIASLFLAAFVAVAPVSVSAENPAPYSGMRTVETDQAFDAFVDKLRGSIKANAMGIVAEACAHCGAKSIGVTIPGNRVIMIFKPQFAVRMLEASVPAGIEAPLRLYVTEQPDGTAKLTYRLPSHTFGAYDVAELTAMGEELDGIVAAIVADATR